MFLRRKVSQRTNLGVWFLLMHLHFYLQVAQECLGNGGHKGVTF